MSNEPCEEFKPSEDDSEVCENCGWLECDHKSAAQLQKEWLESTEPLRKNMETPAAWMRARDLVHEESVNLADAVPLSDFRSVVNYAQWLESMCEQYRLRACEHLTKDENGKSVCGLILKGVGVE